MAAKIGSLVEALQYLGAQFYRQTVIFWGSLLGTYADPKNGARSGFSELFLNSCCCSFNVFRETRCFAKLIALRRVTTSIFLQSNALPTLTPPTFEHVDGWRSEADTLLFRRLTEPFGKIWSDC